MSNCPRMRLLNLQLFGWAGPVTDEQINSLDLSDAFKINHSKRAQDTLIFKQILQYTRH